MLSNMIWCQQKLQCKFEINDIHRPLILYFFCQQNCKTVSPPFCWLLLLHCCDFLNSFPAPYAVYFFWYGKQAVNQQERMSRYVKCQPSLPSHFTCITAWSGDIVRTASTVANSWMNVIKQPNTNKPPASRNSQPWQVSINWLLVSSTVCVAVHRKKNKQHGCHSSSAPWIHLLW